MKVRLEDFCLWSVRHFGLATIRFHHVSLTIVVFHLGRPKTKQTSTPPTIRHLICLEIHVRVYSGPLEARISCLQLSALTEWVQAQINWTKHERRPPAETHRVRSHGLCWLTWSSSQMERCDSDWWTVGAILGFEIDHWKQELNGSLVSWRWQQMLEIKGAEWLTDRESDGGDVSCLRRKKKRSVKGKKEGLHLQFNLPFLSS